MTTRLWLIRHGASQHKELGIIGGPQGCRGLTQPGRTQADLLAQRLRHELPTGPDAIYSSIIPRARETATIIADTWQLGPPHEDCGLCTWHTPPHADGLPWKEYQATNTLAGGGVFRPFEQNNEAWGELVMRTGRTLEELAARHQHQHVLIVCHAEVVNSAMIVFGNLPLAPSFDMRVEPTSITEWLTQGDPAAWPRPRWTLARFNDHAHLGALNQLA